MTYTPPLSQTMAARDQAEENRMNRAAVRRHVREGHITIAEVIGSDAPCLKTAPLWKVLTWAPRCGLRNAQRIIAETTISEGRQLGTLTDRERFLLIDTIARIRPSALRLADG